jgi:hypothetical protein
MTDHNYELRSLGPATQGPDTLDTEIPHLHLDLHDQGKLGVVHLEERPICWPDSV